jgi:hypothetical protein
MGVVTSNFVFFSLPAVNSQLSLTAVASQVLGILLVECEFAIKLRVVAAAKAQISLAHSTASAG